MWDHRYLSRIDFRTIPILLALMFISILVIAATTGDAGDLGEETLFTSVAKSQIRWFAIGWCVYLFFAGLDYRKLKKWTWFLYFGIVLLLLGLFFRARGPKCPSLVQDPRGEFRVPALGICQVDRRHDVEPLS